MTITSEPEICLPSPATTEDAVDSSSGGWRECRVESVLMSKDETVLGVLYATGRCGEVLVGPSTLADAWEPLMAGASIRVRLVAQGWEIDSMT